MLFGDKRVRMKKAWFWIVLVFCAAAIAASAMLFVDYVRPGPVFCSEDAACGALRHTVFAHPFGVPLPVFGLSGYLAIVLAAFLPGRRPQIAQAVLATVGGLGAVFLVFIQIRLHRFCPFCMVVDPSGIVVMGLSIARAVKRWDPPAERRHLVRAGAVLAAAIVVPLVIGFAKPPAPPPISLEVPPPIVEEIKKTPRGKVTVVDFVDFECPFCRATHKELVPLLAEYKDRVRLVRKHVPLRIHPHAIDAARAGCCAELLGKGDDAADALVEADPKELTPEGCEKIAEKLGLDVQRFRACMRDPATDERIKADGETFRAAKGRGLPMLYIGEQRLVGEQDRESLRFALDEASRRL